MEAVSDITNNEASQIPAVGEVPEDTSSKDSGESDFELFLRGLLPSGSGNKVSEEELFAAVIAERIKNLKGEEAATQFQELLDKNKQALQKPDGYVPVEAAAINALKEFRDADGLTAEEADTIYSASFSAAQLDDNKTTLYDGRGGANDPTIAVAVLESALLSARTLVEKVMSGETTVETMSLDSAVPTGAAGASASAVGSGTLSAAPSPGDEHTVPQGTTFDGPNGFLFKPVSENQGTLAILPPEAWTYHVANVLLRDSSGNVIEEGHQMLEGASETGREKWSFSKAGGAYPSNLVVEVTLLDGSKKTFDIPDPSQRYD